MELSERPLTEKIWDFGTKNNKETYMFEKLGSFIADQAENINKQTYIFEKGESFVAAQAENVGSLGAAQA